MPKSLDLSGATLAQLMSELGKRRVKQRENNNGGRPATCTCGECPKCKKREQMKKYRAGKAAK